jgi:hypothetical protein
MKKLFSVLALVAAFTFAMNSANAQESFGSAGLEIAIPLGDFADSGANLGIGGSGTFEVGVSDQLAFLAQAGVLFYATDDVEIPGSDEELGVSITQIPLQVGGRFYLDEQKSGLYLSVLLGVHITSFSQDGYSETIEVPGFPELTQTIEVPEVSDSSTDFSFAPEVGYFLNENISLSARFQFITAETEVVNPTTLAVESESTTNSYIGIRAAYNF